MAPNEGYRRDALLPFIRSWGADAAAEIPALRALITAPGAVGPVRFVFFGVSVFLVGFGEFSIGRSVEFTGGIDDAGQRGGGDARAGDLAPAPATVLGVDRHRRGRRGIRREIRRTAMVAHDFLDDVLVLGTGLHMAGPPVGKTFFV